MSRKLGCAQDQATPLSPFTRATHHGSAGSLATLSSNPFRDASDCSDGWEEARSRYGLPTWFNGSRD